MPLIEISYKKLFPYAPFLNYELRYKWDLVEGEDRESIEETLYNFGQEFHKRKYPNAIVSNEVIVEQKLTKEELTALAIVDINNCKSKEDLETFKNFAKSHSKETFDAYNEKLKTFK